MSYIQLTYWDIALAALLLVVNGTLSILLSLGVARRIFIAAVRMTVQLLLVGLVLSFLFELASPIWTGLMALVMVAVAGYEAMARQKNRFKGWWSYGLGVSTLLVATFSVTILALGTQIRPDPWFDPRYAIPLLGMILGNALTGVSLGLDTLTTAVVRERPSIEARISLGQPRFEAMGNVMRDALRAGFMPIINSMSATGIVSLPGMMTGQILAGVPPAQAVKYQLLVLFLIGGATGFGVVLSVLGGVRRLTDERHRLRLDRLLVRSS
ncbi:MAG: iron export ABC transporter permease subunit FetB [Pseudomonadota bacterium]